MFCSSYFIVCIKFDERWVHRSHKQGQKYKWAATGAFTCHQNSSADISNQLIVADRSTRGNQPSSLRLFGAHGSVEAKNHLLCFGGQLKQCLTLRCKVHLVYLQYSVDIFWTVASFACHQPCVVDVWRPKMFSLPTRQGVCQSPWDNMGFV